MGTDIIDAVFMESDGALVKLPCSLVFSRYGKGVLVTSVVEGAWGLAFLLLNCHIKDAKLLVDQDETDDCQVLLKLERSIAESDLYLHNERVDIEDGQIDKLNKLWEGK